AAGVVYREDGLACPDDTRRIAILEQRRKIDADRGGTPGHRTRDGRHYFLSPFVLFFPDAAGVARNAMAGQS
ncbi:MAG TPA: hypothetical protein VL180_14155, partial [Burkholderiales bacterium]|nr:hypothetical protein [Burkholderiales bacterium]